MICVTSKGSDLQSEVDPRFGRCAYFIFIDPATMEFSAVENTSMNAAQGAGISAGKTVIDGDASAVLTGECGPKAMQTLQSGDVKIYTGLNGTVEQAVQAYNEGSLKAI
ncbi:Dinitrogenase iron-molybdenum cofactor [Anaerohalosphaera lusitana]|uniref:Dinitrogenase iron-molybdenum cofactor n=1 Tax=Anaerohalosphaera lusitana TaxID=1936003 RepID=A0A1U9NL25_9BACT|nr:NifB/NifX family molybdenum-iron cluster-binding protein [Anaerohalosphaera lusitana]AQT68642.1 Dinitrogenase iron-molybdenum cofactor [Anaerohalosphaera lusitana]